MADDKLKLRILYIRDMLLEETDKDHIMSTRQIQNRLEHDHEIRCDRKTVYDDIRSLAAYGMKIKSVTGHHIYNRVKADNEAIFDTVDILYDAILQNRKVKFQYCRWNKKKQLVPRKEEPYVVSPWSMTWSSENYYLVGVCELEDGSHAVRHYRVDKMMETEILDQPREGKEEFSSFDQTAFAKRTFNMYGGQNVNVRMKCRDDLAGVIIDRFGKETMLFPAEEGCFSVDVNIAVSPQFFGWLTGVGEGIQITEPEDVQERYKAYLTGILKNYKGCSAEAVRDREWTGGESDDRY